MDLLGQIESEPAQSVARTQTRAHANHPHSRGCKKARSRQQLLGLGLPGVRTVPPDSGGAPLHATVSEVVSAARAGVRAQASEIDTEDCGLEQSRFD